MCMFYLRSDLEIIISVVELHWQSKDVEILTSESGDQLVMCLYGHIARNHWRK